MHDLTKELDLEQQIKLCEKYHLSVSDADRIAPKTFHARTAAEKIRLEMPALADPTVVDAVRWHTTGHAGMTLTEKLLYLADYIDESRSYPNCVILRRYFFGAEPQRMTMDERLALLRDTLILSFDMTIGDLVAEGMPIAEDTVMARNELMLARAKAEQR